MSTQTEELEKKYVILKLLHSNEKSKTLLAYKRNRDDDEKDNSQIIRPEILKLLKSEIDRDNESKIYKSLSELEKDGKKQFLGFYGGNDCYNYKNEKWFGLSMEPGAATLSEMKDKMEYNIKEACIITLSLIEKLKYLSEKNIIHSDIKPGNIIFSILINDYTFIDFDISLDFNHDREENLSLKGWTKRFVAPEIRKKEKIIESKDFFLKADIFSLGLTIFYLITPKFKRKNLFNDFNLIKKRTDDKNVYEREFFDLLEGMLNMDPNKRFNLSDCLEKIKNIRKWFSDIDLQKFYVKEKK